MREREEGDGSDETARSPRTGSGVRGLTGVRHGRRMFAERGGRRDAAGERISECERIREKRNRHTSSSGSRTAQTRRHERRHEQAHPQHTSSQPPATSFAQTFPSSSVSPLSRPHLSSGSQANLFPNSYRVCKLNFILSSSAPVPADPLIRPHTEPESGIR